MKKAKRGRPLKADALKRTDRIEVKATPDEKAAFEKAAQSTGLSLSDWIRTRLREAAGLN